MERYINADALQQKMTQLRLEQSGDMDKINLIWQVQDMILQAPTADVREVVHGEWRKVYPTYELNIIARKHEPCYVCSKCNAHVDVKTPFCPNCGAYMREE